MLIFDYINKIAESFMRPAVDVRFDGKVLVGIINDVHADSERIGNLVCKSIKFILKEYEEYFYEESRKFDDYYINVVVLFDYETDKGFRVVERNVLSHRFEIGMENIDYMKELITVRSQEIIEEYNLERVDFIRIKIF